MIVLDTNVVSEIALRRPNADVVAWLAQQGQAELFLGIPVIAALSYGGYRALLRDKSSRYLDALSALVGQKFRNKIIPNDLASAMKFGEILAKREVIGRPIGPLDAMIAAICLVHGAKLATCNVRDFDGLDLGLVNPFEAGA